MEIALDQNSQDFVDAAVRDGRYASPSEAVSEALRLLQEQQRETVRLRAAVDDAIARGGEFSDEEVDAMLEKTFRQLEREGY
jgi:putative addiction module CopG family antidote